MPWRHFDTSVSAPDAAQPLRQQDATAIAPEDLVTLIAVFRSTLAPGRDQSADERFRMVLRRIGDVAARGPVCAEDGFLAQTIEDHGRPFVLRALALACEQSA